jgi:uncharacterized coiled-coil DUF342 family protein
MSYDHADELDAARDELEDVKRVRDELTEEVRTLRSQLESLAAEHKETSERLAELDEFIWPIRDEAEALMRAVKALDVGGIEAALNDARRVL